MDHKFRGDVYAPTYFGDKLVVCSNQKDRLYRTVLGTDGLEPIDLYVVDVDSSFKEKPFDQKFRTIYNDGPATFDSDGKLIVVSRNLKTDQKYKSLQNDKNHLGLFMSNQSAESWTDLVPLPFNSEDYNCTHPSLSEDGKTLIFSSDKPGGEGGYDLWITQYENGNWSEPTNLGPRINSDNDDIFPSYFLQKLYFSSNREEIGGLDLYMVDMGSDTSSVILLPEPLNSTSDDFGIATKDIFTDGYFTSNRNGRDELLKFDFEFPEFTGCDSIVETTFCYTLYEENSHGVGGEGTEALIFEWSINDVKKQGIEIDYCFPGTGDYIIKLDIIDTILKKTYFEQAYYEITLEYEVQPYITSADTVEPGEFFSLSGTNSNLPDMMIEEYFWDFGDGHRGYGENTKHMFKEEGEYNVQLGVIGFEQEARVSDCVWKTIVVRSGMHKLLDSIGNLLPSQLHDSTLFSAVEYFNADPSDTSQVRVFTIEAARMSEKFPEGSPEMELLKKYSTKIEYLEDKDVWVYYVGNYENLSTAYDTWSKLLADGFDEAVVRSIIIDVNDPAISLDHTFVMENLQFDFNKWDLREDAIPEVDKIVKIMTSIPEMHVYITAHTDNVGPIDHNKKLSNRRARSVSNYLISNGITKERIKWEGMGESKPIASNETEEGQQKNRRVEFTFSRVE